jgi:1,4-dihydroxy-6-naphthoate synthase
MKLTLGFSPCPNDCFIFDAMIHHKIDTEGLTFDVVMEDVESLNQKAFKGVLDITKLSFHAFAYVTDEYQMLYSGAALGKGCGPLLVYSPKSKVQSPKFKVQSSTRIAIPGKYTTANFLLSLAFPQATNKEEMLFSDIEEAVFSGKVDAGLIIHENRFTYEQKGLKKIVDLGEYWEQLTQAPIPLGGIVVKKEIDNRTKQTINRVLRRSVEYAFANPLSSQNFVKQHAQEMSIEVMQKHIDLYVNEYSIDMGEEGTRAVNILFEKARQLKLISTLQEQKQESLFID